MDESITRKDFCGRLGGHALLAWAALALPGCGGGGSDGGTPAPAPSPSTSSSCGNTIGANHGHVLTVARADLDATTDRSYDISGTAGHAHQVALTLAQLATLKSGGTVIVTSSATSLDGHTHAVTVSCV